MNNMKRNWVTSLFGILMIAMAVLKIVQDPAAASNPDTIALIGGGAGLLAAKDSNKSGTGATPGLGQ